MTDQRPQYGEIATVEEQRRAAGLPPIAEAVPESGGPVPRPTAPETTAPSRPGRPVDRFITIALLAYGLVNVVVTALSYLDFSTAMNEVMNLLGIDGEFKSHRHRHHEGPDSLGNTGMRGLRHVRLGCGGNAAVTS